MHQHGLPLVVQWLGICLPMWGTSLVQEDSTSLGAAEPMCCNYWSPCLEPMLHKKRSHHNQKPVLHNEECPSTLLHCSLQLEKACTKQQRPRAAKYKLKERKKKKVTELNCTSFAGKLKNVQIYSYLPFKKRNCMNFWLYTLCWLKSPFAFRFWETKLDKPILPSFLSSLSLPGSNDLIILQIYYKYLNIYFQRFICLGGTLKSSDILCDMNTVSELVYH